MISEGQTYTAKELLEENPFPVAHVEWIEGKEHIYNFTKNDARRMKPEDHVKIYKIEAADIKMKGYKAQSSGSRAYQITNIRKPYSGRGT